MADISKLAVFGLRTRSGCTFLERLWSGKGDKNLMSDLQRSWAGSDLMQNNQVITSSNAVTKRRI